MSPVPLKLLIVDDTPENLLALEALLRQPGVQVIAAGSGAEALEQCLVHDFCLALLDVQMPEMDGVDLAELMRGAGRTKHVPIVFVTAASRDQARMFRGYESGAVDFLYKPIDPHVLTSKVNVFLDLARQRVQLAEALKLNEMFVGILGHDLRNPLSALVSGVELLSMMAPRAEQERVLGRMHAAGERMTAMIRDLLDLTRVRLGAGLGSAGAGSQVDLCEVLVRTIDELRSIHRRDLVLEGPPSCVATGDPERLVQLFSNLLGNAIDHGTPGTTITARIARRDLDVVIEVHNAGMIPSAVRHALFEPFRRGGAPTSQGLGLGLFIAQQIARAHGGDIEVRSSEAHGTVFAVRLPLERAA